jgi:hypothetical protein
MGFFSNILSATVKVVLTPVAIVTDAVAIVKGEEPDNTKDLLKSAGEDLEDAIDDATGN